MEKYKRTSKYVNFHKLPVKKYLYLRNKRFSIHPVDKDNLFFHQ